MKTLKKLLEHSEVTLILCIFYLAASWFFIDYLVRDCFEIFDVDSHEFDSLIIPIDGVLVAIFTWIVSLHIRLKNNDKENGE